MAISFQPVKATPANKPAEKAKPVPAASKSPARSDDGSKPKRGPKPSGNAKKLLTIRLDTDLLDHYRATGDGWQSRINDDLRKAAGLK